MPRSSAQSKRLCRWLDMPRLRWFTDIVLISQKQVFACASVVALALVLLAPSRAEAQTTTDAEGDHQPATRLSGYMDFHYTKPELGHGQLDFHRFVLLVTHEFSPRIRFVGELELAHGF